MKTHKKTSVLHAIRITGIITLLAGILIGIGAVGPFSERPGGPATFSRQTSSAAGAPKISLIPSTVAAQTVPPDSTCAGATPPPTTYGQVKQNITAPSAGTYRIWSRVKVPDTTNNSYYLQVDSAPSCIVGEDITPAANTWVWTNVRMGGTTYYKSLSAGTHAITIAGREPGVQEIITVFRLEPVITVPRKT
jgi:hypothetical protein